MFLNWITWSNDKRQDYPTAENWLIYGSFSAVIRSHVWEKLLMTWENTGPGKSRFTVVPMLWLLPPLYKLRKVSQWRRALRYNLLCAPTASLPYLHILVLWLLYSSTLWHRVLYCHQQTCFCPPLYLQSVFKKKENDRLSIHTRSVCCKKIERMWLKCFVFFLCLYALSQVSTLVTCYFCKCRLK